MSKLKSALIMIVIVISSASAYARTSGMRYGRSDKFETKSIATFFVGMEMLSTDWEPVNHPIMLGVNVNYTPMNWPVGGEFIAKYSRATARAIYTLPAPVNNTVNADLLATITEIDIGLYKYLQISDSNFYVNAGGGAGLLSANMSGTEVGTTNTAKSNDSALAFYVHGGIFYEFESYTSVNNFFIGFDVRARFGGEVTLYDKPMAGTAFAFAGMAGIIF